MKGQLVLGPDTDLAMVIDGKKFGNMWSCSEGQYNEVSIQLAYLFCLGFVLCVGL